MMVGRETFGVRLQDACETTEPVYELDGISLAGKHGKNVWMMSVFVWVKGRFSVLPECQATGRVN